MLIEVQPAEHFAGVDAQDLFGRPSRVKRKEDGDQTAHDMCVTIADESKTRRAAIGIDLGGQPHLADAALHLVGGTVVLLGQGLKPPPKLDDCLLYTSPSPRDRS